MSALAVKKPAVKKPVLRWKMFLGATGRGPDAVIRSRFDMSDWTIGEWRNVGPGELGLCQHGFHCSKEPLQTMKFVQGDVLAVVEVAGGHKTDEIDGKQVWRRMRIVKAYRWTIADAKAVYLFACMLVDKRKPPIYASSSNKRSFTSMSSHKSRDFGSTLAKQRRINAFIRERIANKQIKPRKK